MWLLQVVGMCLPSLLSTQVLWLATPQGAQNGTRDRRFSRRQVLQPDFVSGEFCEFGHVSTSHLSNEGAEFMTENVFGFTISPGTPVLLQELLIPSLTPPAHGLPDQAASLSHFGPSAPLLLAARGRTSQDMWLG